jgi:hypothetical protein
MNVDRSRLFSVTLVLGDGNLAAGTGKDIWVAQTRCELLEAELCLRTTGGTSGNTDVDVKKNGTLVWTSPGLRIVQGAAAPATVRAKPTVGLSSSELAGVVLEPGDSLTADIAAIPGTASAGGFVRLLLRARDI